jgi:PAS domain S-box-containing protein
MAFDKNIPEQNNSQLQPREPKSARLCLDSISQLGNTTEISQKSKNQFQALIESTLAMIFVIKKGKVYYANPIAELTTGYSRSQLLSNSDFYRQLNPNGYNLASLNCQHNYEIKIEVKSDRECWLNCSWKRVEWDNEPAMLLTAFDVTKYKQTEAKIHQALIAEKELCKNKAQFVSMVSHEFRTPLNIISFSTSLLKRHLDQWTETKQLKYLNRLQTAVEQLGNLMDEVLILGKAEAGKLRFNPQPLNLASFCDQLLIEVNLSLSHCLNINFVNTSKCETVLADKSLLRLVLLNLLSNAIKYSCANSTIEFIVSRQSELLKFQITDRGIGIPLEEQPKIFEPFYRSQNVNDIPGNGLGLAIVKKLLELQGGQINIKSKVEVGTTFKLTLPLI